uniref:Alpha-2-macroglobulin homolog (Fragments) n=1 Tax=Homarus americanus TaxID=6706 RepID=A2M_HOMAM|nr:RecName: Full=Alpha-2-macroglobulin homolog; Short=Alpha-2-M [Homarus americanus]
SYIITTPRMWVAGSPAQVRTYVMPYGCGEQNMVNFAPN